MVLYDGECGFCDLSVQWLLDHDRDARLVFAPLQGPTAAAVKERQPHWPADLDSLVLVDVGRDGRERVAWHSGAVLGICAYLPWPWRLALVLRIVPAPLRDLCYRAFARIRYRVFGRVESCRLPTPGERARFLP